MRGVANDLTATQITRALCASARVSHKRWLQIFSNRFCSSAMLLIASLFVARVGVAALVFELTPENSLIPSGQIHATDQSRDGKVYMATPAGLAAYAGHTIKVFGRKAGLTTHGLRAVLAHSDGTIFVGGDAGVDISVDRQAFYPLRPRGSEGATKPWEYGFVEDMIEAHDASVWIAASAGLLHWSADEGVRVERSSLLHTQFISTLAQTRARVWVAGPQLGLAAKVDESWRAPASDDWREAGQIFVIAESASDRLLVGGSSALLEINDDGSLHRRYAGAGAISAVTRDGDTIWLGSSVGLERIIIHDDGSLSRELMRGDIYVNDIYIDEMRNVWISTDKRGLMRINTSIDVVEQPSVSCNSGVMSIRRGDGEDILVGGDRCSWRMREGQSTQIGALDSVQVWDMIEFSGHLWAATAAGLYRVEGNERRLQGIDNDVASAPGRALQINQGALHVGTQKGLAKLDRDGVWQTILAADGASPGYVYTLAPLSDGTLLVGTIGQGLWRLNGESLTRADVKGLREQSNIYGIAVRENDDFVFAQDDQLIVVSGEQVRELALATDLPVAAWSLAWRGQSIFLGTAKGLYQIDALSGAQQCLITTDIGMPSDEFTTSRSLLIENDGPIYAGTSAGLAIVNADKVAQGISAPTVRLGSIAWQGVSAPLGSPAQVERGSWRVDVSFYAPWYVSERALRFRTRLIGFEDDWSEPSASPQVSYTSLPYGEYQLEVQTFAPITGWGKEQTIWAFSVLPKYHEQTFFRVLAGLALALLIWLAWRVRTARLVRRGRVLKAQVAQQTVNLQRTNRELRAANDFKDRMVGVVAHDLRNPIAAVKMYAEVLGDGNDAVAISKVEMIQRIADAASYSLAMVEELLDLKSIETGRITLTLAPCSLESVIEIITTTTGEIARSKGIRIEVELSEGMPPVNWDKHRVVQIIDNLLNNAMKASVSGMSIRIAIRQFGDEICISIIDRAGGIEAGKLEHVELAFMAGKVSPSAGRPKIGFGLLICHALAAAHGGRCELKNDLGRGCTFSVYLPI